MSNKGQLLQDPFLNALRKEHVPVSIYLVNGIKLQGQIESFDQYVVLLRNTVTQMVYKHAISTIVPGRAVNFSANEAGDETCYITCESVDYAKVLHVAHELGCKLLSTTVFDQEFEPNPDL